MTSDEAERVETLRAAAREEAASAPLLSPAHCDYLNAQFREEKALIVARIKKGDSHAPH